MSTRWQCSQAATFPFDQVRIPGEMPCQSSSRVVGSRRTPSKGCWLSPKIVRKLLPSSSRASEVGSSRGIFGHHDWLAIGEFPDAKAAASAVLAAAGGGSLSDVETTLAMTAKDAFATFESAAKAAKAFRSAGRS